VTNIKVLSVGRQFQCLRFEHRKEFDVAEDITLFTAVDRTKEPDFFRRFLDEGNKLPDIIASKPIILAGLQLTGGENVLDAGCGMGDDTFAIARLVGSQGHTVGGGTISSGALGTGARADGRCRWLLDLGRRQVFPRLLEIARALAARFRGTRTISEMPIA
jgi:SAM-dependent methyltransferase